MGQLQAILIAGPTASGKSALAMDLAERHDGVVVNADSMQVFDGLEILTARPHEADLARVPHRLYGHVDPSAAYSVGEYLRDLEPTLTTIKESGRLPIVVGGTGLYFRALLGHLDAMPEVPSAVRQKWRQQLVAEGPGDLHDILKARDPAAAVRIRPSDGQRILRALEVGEASGSTLSEFQRGRGGTGLLDAKACLKIVITPERPLLRQRIAERFARMLESGGLEEVETFRRRPGAMTGNAARAIGVAELAAVLDDEINVMEAASRAITRSRQYAKRQETWFRHQFDAEWNRIPSIEALALQRMKAASTSIR